MKYRDTSIIFRQLSTVGCNLKTEIWKKNITRILSKVCFKVIEKKCSEKDTVRKMQLIHVQIANRLHLKMMHSKMMHVSEKSAVLKGCNFIEHSEFQQFTTVGNKSQSNDFIYSLNSRYILTYELHRIFGQGPIFSSLYYLPSDPW